MKRRTDGETMTCRAVVARMSDLIDGDDLSAVAAHAREHIAACEHCRRYFASLHIVVRLTADAHAPAAPAPPIPIAPRSR